MSVFILKLIAVVSMVLDHLGLFLFPRFAGENVYHALRAVGRTAFPVYAFLIVNGYQKTRDAKRYLTRLLAFAVVSQIPFVMCFDANPFPEGGGLHAALAYRGFLCGALIITAGAAWLTAVRRGASVVWPVLALVLAVCRVDYGGVRLLSGRLNVFYTLALGLSAIALLDGLLETERDWLTLLMRGLGLFAALFLIRENADYGAMGIALILALWLTRDMRAMQAAVIVGWCAMKYLSGKPLPYFLCGALAAVLVLLYNGRQGRPLKSAFYLVYPVHLLILGTLTVYYTLA